MVVQLCNLERKSAIGSLQWEDRYRKTVTSRRVMPLRRCLLCTGTKGSALRARPYAAKLPTCERKRPKSFQLLENNSTLKLVLI